MNDNAKLIIKECIQFAKGKHHPDDRAHSFLVALSGALQREDMVLANEVLALVEGEG